MNANDIQNKVNEIRELTRMADELSAEIEAVKDALKEYMTDKGVDELTGVDYKVTWKSVSTTRIDSKKLSEDFPDVANKYTKTTTTRRFCVA